MLQYDDATHTYTLDGIRLKSVTQILREAGLTDYANVNPAVLQRSQDFGTAVHDMTYLYDRNDLDMESLDHALVPLLDAWKSFLCVSGWETAASEQLVYSRRYLYAGRYDRKGIYNGKLTILDIKTGMKSKATVKTTGIQLAGYQIAHDELSKDGKVKQRMAVWLTGDGSFKTETYTDKCDQSRFLACLTVANIKEEIK